MRFADPEYAFILAAVLAALGIYEFISAKKRSAYVIFPKTSFFSGQPGAVRNYLRKALKVLQYAALILLITAIARPQEGKILDHSTDEGIDIVIALDTSTSMKAVDFKPLNRMDAAKQVIEEFVKNRPNDRVGLVIFAGLAFTQSPLTTDKDSLAKFIKNIEIGDTGLDGTALGSAIMTSVNRLKNSKAKSKVIILVTDGNNNMGEIDPLTAAKIAKKFDMKVYTVGVGNPEGGLYEIDDPFFGKREVRHTSDGINEDALKEISKITSGEYFRAQNRQSFEYVMKKIDSLEKNEIKKLNFTVYNELYKRFAFAAFIILLLVLILENTWLRKLP
ncbi:MAG: VWA domain-containing protein [Endomicrobium sp.]|jgi:Ca-activated chloride channel family protein|nr:VWA domain-containing protein [Endomicrobium sp.]